MDEISRKLSSRRALLRAGMASVAGAMWLSGFSGREAQAAESGSPTQLPLITKIIPSTGERLPPIGLGTDKFSHSERVAIRDEIARMHELGGTLLDTSADYGESEEVIGEAIAGLGLRDRLFVATKLVAGGNGLFGLDIGGRPSFERSQRRLRTRRIDLLQVHNLDGVDELVPMMQDWKHAGLIRYFGITTSEGGQHAELMRYMRKYPLDFIQVDYSLANRDAAREVLPLARERRMAVLINVPFGYGSALAQAMSRPLPPWAAEIDVGSWAQLLLKYVISHPAVTCAIPGSTQIRHLQDNQGAARGRLPDEAMRRRMEQLWDRQTA